MRNKTLIIAEIGANHNGNIQIAKKMVDQIVKCGADIAKFQTVKPENLVSKYAQKADYQKKTTGSEESQLEMIKKISLPIDSFEEMKSYCEKAGIEFLSTPFDLDSIDYLDNIGVKRWKIPSGEITNLPYLIKIAKTTKPIIMSTGMCTLDEIRESVKVLNENGAGNLTILHCTTEYPAPKNEVNLSAMKAIRDEFNVPVGYSDHTEGIEISLAAVAMGATVIEKHFTLDRNMPGPDQMASTDPAEFKKMVESIRNIESAIGNGKKEIGASESKNIVVARKSIVAAREIKKGEIYSESNLTTKRPGNGISPMKWFEVMGKQAPRDYQVDENIEI